MNLFLLAACSGDPVADSPPAVEIVPAPAPEGAAPEAPVPEGAAPAPSHGAPPASGLISPGAVGVMQSVGNDLLIIFPAAELVGFDPAAVPAEGAVWDAPSELTVFGADGTQAQMPAPSFAVIRWCGDQHRLEGRVPMPGPPPRELMVDPQHNILSFVRVGTDGLQPSPEAKAPVATGDLDKDGKAEAVLAGDLDLVTARAKSALRCNPAKPGGPG